MMEIKPEIVDRVMTHSTTVVAAKYNKNNHQVINNYGYYEDGKPRIIT
jgi:hypothetical protein